MNLKMKEVADEIGKCIYREYNEDYIETLFEGGIVVEDVIFQVLVECCRYAYLKTAEKHPLKYYIEREGLELDLTRKNVKRIFDYVNEHLYFFGISYYIHLK